MDADLGVHGVNPDHESDDIDFEASLQYADDPHRTRSASPTTEDDAPLSSRRDMEGQTEPTWNSRIGALNNIGGQQDDDDGDDGDYQPTGASSNGNRGSQRGRGRGGRTVAPSASLPLIGRGAPAERAQLLNTTLGSIGQEVHTLGSSLISGFQGLSSVLERSRRADSEAILELASTMREQSEATRAATKTQMAIANALERIVALGQSSSVSLLNGHQPIDPPTLEASPAHLLSRMDPSPLPEDTVMHSPSPSPSPSNQVAASEPPLKAPSSRTDVQDGNERSLLMRLSDNAESNVTSKDFSVYLAPCQRWVSDWQSNAEIVNDIIGTKHPQSASMPLFQRLYHKQKQGRGLVLHLTFNDPLCPPSTWITDARHFATRWNELFADDIVPAYYGELPPMTTATSKGNTNTSGVGHASSASTSAGPRAGPSGSHAGPSSQAGGSRQ